MLLKDSADLDHAGRRLQEHHRQSSANWDTRQFPLHVDLDFLRFSWFLWFLWFLRQACCQANRRAQQPSGIMQAAMTKPARTHSMQCEIRLLVLLVLLVFRMRHGCRTTVVRLHNMHNMHNMHSNPADSHTADRSEETSNERDKRFAESGFAESGFAESVWCVCLKVLCGGKVTHATAWICVQIDWAVKINNSTLCPVVGLAVAALQGQARFMLMHVHALDCEYLNPTDHDNPQVVFQETLWPLSTKMDSSGKSGSDANAASAASAANATAASAASAASAKASTSATYGVDATSGQPVARTQVCVQTAPATPATRTDLLAVRVKIDELEAIYDLVQATLKDAKQALSDNVKASCVLVQTRIIAARE